MPREYQHFKLRKARKPTGRSWLASTVAVFRENGDHGYCYIEFSDSFVAFVGKRLPRGVSPQDPAYLEARYVAYSGCWDIYARYLHSDDSVKLWTAGQRPLWLTFNLESDNGNGSTEAGGTRRDDTTSKPRPRSTENDPDQTQRVSLG